MTVHVEQRHIDQGTPRKCAECPISVAVLDALALAYPWGMCNILVVRTSPGTPGDIEIVLQFKDFSNSKF